jgi:short-subunit dehydrogenase
MTKLTHSTVLITGASSGIGRAVAERLGDRASTVAITGRRPELLEETARTIRAKGSRCLTYPGDATDPDSAREVVADLVDRTGGIDAALLNVGMGPAYHMATATVEDIETCMRQNFSVTVNYLVPLIAHMRTRRAGLIAHTNSLAGIVPTPMQGPYCAAKSATRMLLDAARIELHGSGVRLLTVHPGFVATDATADDGVPAPFEMSAADAAGRIVAAMESSKERVYFPWQTTLLARMLRGLPAPLSGTIMRRMTPAEY